MSGRLAKEQFIVLYQSPVDRCDMAVKELAVSDDLGHMVGIAAAASLHSGERKFLFCRPK